MKISGFNMKRLFLIIFMISTMSVFCQETWEPVILDVAGHTVVKKVAVFFQKIVCQNDEYIVVKFVNDNDYAVTVKWYDAVQLNSDYSWVKKYDSTPKKVLELAAKSEIKGDCMSQDNLDCVIKLKDFIVNPLLYQSYAMYRFEIPNVK